MSEIVDILNTRFAISTGSNLLLEYTSFFLNAYVDTENGLPITGEYKIFVKTANIPAGLQGEPIKIHTSNHEYWDFFGEYKIEHGIRTVLWKNNTLVNIHEDNVIELVFSNDINKKIAGETLFHVMRSIALYNRNNERANMLHGSCVVIDGKGIIFTGGISAGKTSFLVETVLKLNASPLSNDRVVLKSMRDEIRAFSWPSYASFCEGTLLNYKELEKGALRYQFEEDHIYRTQQWHGSLTYSFDKKCKRAYPMQWLCDCLGKTYIKDYKVSHIFISRVDASCRQNILCELDYRKDHDLILQNITNELFDMDEPSFEPWHGFKLSRGSLPAEQLIENMVGAGCGFYYMHIHPGCIDSAVDFICSKLDQSQ